MARCHFVGQVDLDFPGAFCFSLYNAGSIAMPGLPHVFSINYYFQVKIELQESCQDCRVNLHMFSPSFSLTVPFSVDSFAKARTPMLVHCYKLNSRFYLEFTNFPFLVIILCTGLSHIASRCHASFSVGLCVLNHFDGLRSPSQVSCRVFHCL